MLAHRLYRYDELPVISPELLPSSKYATYGELVLNLHSFSHPGTNKVLQHYEAKNLKQAFEAKGHSWNARLMVAGLAVGRTSNEIGVGYDLFKQIQNWEMCQVHEKMMQKVDFHQPLLTQLAKLDAQEQEAFVTIPKFAANHLLRFQDSEWSEFLYLDSFWRSHAVFQVTLIALLWYLFSSDCLLNSALRVGLLLAGIIKWTLLEYLFHRFDLHRGYLDGTAINGHLIHHAFPSFRYKLALSCHRILIDETVFFLAYHYIAGLEVAETLHILLGLHISLTMYDTLHYYFHFGPELDVPVLRDLRRNHMKHHFRDANRGFGVTNTLWDHIFGTQHLL